MPRRQAARISQVLAVLGLVVLPLVVWGCVSGTPEIPEFPGTAAQIRNYYEAHGTERSASCVNMLMQTITESHVVRQTPDQLVLAVTYYYQPFSDPYPENGICKGFGTRDFTFARSGDGWRLTDMGGNVRR